MVSKWLRQIRSVVTGSVDTRKREALLSSAFSAQLQDFLAAPETSQGFNRRLHNVRVVAGTQRFGQYIFYTGGFDDGPHTATGNHAGSRRSRTQQNSSAAKFPNYLVRNCIFLNGDRDHRIPRRLGCFANCLRDFIRFAKAVPNTTFVIPGDDQCAETEPAPTFNHFRAAVDEHHFLGRIAFLSTAITLVIATTISAFVCHIFLCGEVNRGLIPAKSALELQAGSAGRIRQRFHLPVIAESSAIKYD
jgi:hypothetical protein